MRSHTCATSGKVELICDHSSAVSGTGDTFPPQKVSRGFGKRTDMQHVAMFWLKAAVEDFFAKAVVLVLGD